MSFWNPFKRTQDHSSAAQQPDPEREIKVVVKWNKDRFNIPIPKPNETPLSTLVQTLSAQTSLPPNKLKLIYNGGVMKNMNLPLASYGLQDGSLIVLVGSNETVDQSKGVLGAVREQQNVKKKEEVPKTEDGLVEFLSGKRKIVEDMNDELIGFRQDCERYLQSKSASTSDEAAADPTVPVQTWTKLQQAHARLTEILLQHLLKLDGIEIQSSMSKARAERKEAVRVVQREMDGLDAIWARVKEHRE